MSCIWFLIPVLLLFLTSLGACWLGKKEGLEARREGAEPVIKRSWYFKLLATGAIISVLGWMIYFYNFGFGWDFWIIYFLYNTIPILISSLYGQIANHFAFGNLFKKWYEVSTEWICIIFHIFLIITFPFKWISEFGINPFSWFNPKSIEAPNF